MSRRPTPLVGQVAALKALKERLKSATGGGGDGAGAGDGGKKGGKEDRRAAKDDKAAAAALKFAVRTRAARLGSRTAAPVPWKDGAGGRRRIPASRRRKTNF